MVAAAPAFESESERLSSTASGRPLAPWARNGVLAIVVVTAGLLTAINGRYGYLSDELYFLAAGKHHLDWGYMDQQPLVPLLAAAADALAPGNLHVFRLPTVVMMVVGIVATSLLARELGGDRRAQVLAAAAYPLSPWLLLSGHWLAAASMEPAQWTVILWLLTRWVRLHRNGQRRDRLLLAAGFVATAAIQTKFQIVVLGVAVLVAVAAVGPRSMLGRPALWAGAALTLGTAVPTLWWQARHAWPALDMGTVVGTETSRWLFLPSALFYSGVAVGAVLCVLGVWTLLRSQELRAYRFLGWTVVGVALFFTVTSGRPNYLAGLYGLLFAAAAVGLCHRRETHGARRRWVPWPAYLLSAVLPLVLLPLYPPQLLAAYPGLASYSRLYETGWPELAATTARAYHALPPETRERTAVVGQSYPITGALDVHGVELGLPVAHSPHRGYWFFGAPPDSADSVLYVGVDGALDPYFDQRRTVDTVDSELVNIAQGVPITHYEQPTVPWSELWPRLRRL